MSPSFDADLRLNGETPQALYLGSEKLWPPPPPTTAHFTVVSDIADYLHPLSSVPDDYEQDVVNNRYWTYPNSFCITCSDGSGYVLGINQVDRRDAVTRNHRRRFRVVKFDHAGSKQWETNWDHALTPPNFSTLMGFIQLADGRYCALVRDRRNSVSPYFYDMCLLSCNADGTGATHRRLGHLSASASSNQGILSVEGFCEDNQGNLWLFADRGWSEAGVPDLGHYQRKYLIKLDNSFNIVFTRELQAGPNDRLQWAIGWPHLAVRPGDGSAGLFLWASLQEDDWANQPWKGGLRILRIDGDGLVVWHRNLPQLKGYVGTLASDASGDVLALAENFGEAYSSNTYEGDNLALVQLNGSTGELIAAAGVKLEMLPYGGWWEFDESVTPYAALTPVQVISAPGGRLVVTFNVYGGANYSSDTLLLAVLERDLTAEPAAYWRVAGALEFCPYAGRKHGGDYMWWDTYGTSVSATGSHLTMAAATYVGWPHLPMDYTDDNNMEPVAFHAPLADILDGSVAGTYGRDPKWVTLAAPEVYGREDITSVPALDLSITTANQISVITGLPGWTPEPGLATPVHRMGYNVPPSGRSGQTIDLVTIVYSQSFFYPEENNGDKQPASAALLQNGITDEIDGAVLDLGYELLDGTWIEHVWVQMDFGAICRVRSVFVAGDFNETLDGWGPDSASWYSLEYSSDGVRWDYLTDTGLMIDGVKQITGFDIRCRYLRIRGHENMWPLALSEFYAISDTNPNPVLPSYPPLVPTEAPPVDWPSAQPETDPLFNFYDPANIGQPVGGGYFGGLISLNGDGIATHALIVAPVETGARGLGYPTTTMLSVRVSPAKRIVGATSFIDGVANTKAMLGWGIENFPAAQFCTGLTIGGYSDWYLPSLGELLILYGNLKPTTELNSTNSADYNGATQTIGVNPYAVPPNTTGHTAAVPAQTAVALFQAGGAQAWATSVQTWSSTDKSSRDTWNMDFTIGDVYGSLKIAGGAVRAIRRVPVGPPPPIMEVPVAIGEFYEGGYFAGYISHTADGVPTHALIVAPRESGASGAGYPLTTNYSYKFTRTVTPGANSDFDGWANTQAMIAANIGNFPAANFCVTRNINGYTDWYMPARFEYQIAYANLKPDTTSNNTASGVNPYAVPPRVSTFTAGDPAQTAVLAFRSGGAQAFTTSAGPRSSTELDSLAAWGINMQNGQLFSNDKTFVGPVHAFRRIPLPLSPA